mmetsp:Transcript_49887/g.101516  ORF Transcript_49887/g.101516 Transcript_49887/m.101516 type:complete len:253 (-) Transcript_49887:2813-3571(-)
MQPVLDWNRLCVLLLAGHFRLQPRIHLRWSCFTLQLVAHGVAIGRPEEDGALVLLHPWFSTAWTSRGVSSRHGQGHVVDLQCGILLGWNHNFLFAAEIVGARRFLGGHLWIQLPVAVRGVLDHKTVLRLRTHLREEFQQLRLTRLAHALATGLQHQWRMTLQNTSNVSYGDSNVHILRVQLAFPGVLVGSLELHDPLMRGMEGYHEVDILLRTDKALRRCHREDLAVLRANLKAEFRSQVPKVVQAHRLRRL